MIYNRVGSRNLRQVIGANIAKRRIELGLSQTQLAHALSKTHDWASKRERGIAGIALEDLPDVMRALQIDDPSWLLQAQSIPDPQSQDPAHPLPQAQPDSLQILIQPPRVG